MKKISLMVMCCMMAYGLPASHAVVDGSPVIEDSDTAASDSAVDVVAYFCIGDTCEYWINEGKWKVNGKDTVKLTDVATKQLDHDMQNTEYMSWTYFDDGWPCRVVKQDKRMVGELGKLSQTYIEACRFAQRKK